jgi:hypothetical protein
MAGSSLPQGYDNPTSIDWRDFTKTFSGIPEWQAQMIMTALNEKFRTIAMERVPYGQKREPVVGADGAPILDAKGNPTFKIVRDERFPEKVAPLSKEFERASKGIQAGLKRRADSNTYRVAYEEIDKARHSDIHSAAIPYLEKASTEPTEYIDGYLKRFRENMMQPLLSEAEDYFTNKIAPNVNNRYITKGAWYSGARQKALRDAKSDLHKNTLREAKKMAFEAERDAHEYLHKHHGRHLGSAQLAADTIAREKEAKLATANILPSLSARKQAQEMADFEAVKGIGHIREEHEQRKRNEVIKEQEREAAEAERRADSLLNATRGHEVGKSTTTGSLPPLPPRASNPIAQGISALEQAQARGATGFKKGGSIKTKYANGGHVSPIFPQYHDAQLSAFNTPEMQEMREIGAHLKHGHGNPALSAMGASGAAMGMAGPHVSPFQAFSYGTAKGLEKYHDIHEANLVNKQRAANLIEKINNSRLEQHKVLAAYQQKQKEFAEKQRLHNAQIAHYGAQNEALKARSEGPMMSSEDMGDMPTKKMTKEREERINDSEKSFKRAVNLYNKAKKAQEKLSDIDSGSFTGTIAQKTPWGLGPFISGVLGAGKPDHINDAMATSEDLVLAKRDFEGKGGNSVAELMTRKAGKAGVDRSPKYNMEYTGDSMSDAINIMKEDIREAKENGASPNRIRHLQEIMERLLSPSENSPQKGQVEQDQGMSLEAKKEALRQKIAEKKAALGVK